MVVGFLEEVYFNMTIDTSNYYIKPAEMQDLIIEMYRSHGDISEELGSMIMDISEKRPYSTNFINYTYTCDMKGDANIKMVEALCDRKYKPYRHLFDEQYIWGWIDDKRVKVKTNNTAKLDFRCLDSVAGYYWAMVPCKKTVINKIFISESGEFIEIPEKEINYDSVTLVKETNEEFHDNSLPKIKNKNQIFWSLPKRLPEACKIYLYEDEKPKLAENNPFSYMTMICTHAFINRIKKEEKNRDAIDRFKEEKYNEFEEDNHQIKRSKLSDEEDELWNKE